MQSILRGDCLTLILLGAVFLVCCEDHPPHFSIDDDAAVPLEDNDTSEDSTPETSDSEAEGDTVERDSDTGDEIDSEKDCIDCDDKGDEDTEIEDLCPNDPLKTEPGICGCGTPDDNCEPGIGLIAVFFKDDHCRRIAFTRLDDQVSFDWGEDAPEYGLNKDDFSVRWEGRVRAPRSESITFIAEYSNTKEGVRLWVDGEKLVNEWKIDKDNKVITQVSDSIVLKAGHYYDLRLEYYDKEAEASIKLMWKSPHIHQEVIPKMYLYPLRHTRAEYAEDYEAVDETFGCKVTSARSQNRAVSLISILRRFF